MSLLFHRLQYMITFFSWRPRRISTLAFLMLIILSCKKNDDRVAVPQTVTDRILEDSQLSLFRAVVAQAGISDAFKDGNLTLFAPTDSAFQASGLSNVAAIMSIPKEQARTLVLYHTLYGSIASAKIPSGVNAVEMVSKSIAFFNKSSNGTIYINNAKVIQADLSVANGYVHKINRVLSPPAGNLLTTVQSNANLTFLSAALKRIGTSNPNLLATLTTTISANPVTIFAPNDDAFKGDSKYNSLAAIESADAQTLINMVLYHVTSGALFSNQFQTGAVTSLFNSNKFTLTVASNQTTLKGNKNTTVATIKQADLSVNNGVIHIIDKVLQP